ncbi:MAG: pilus assembly protein [Actinobacteria bacterium]|nr:pilus assembly protein [Actinomycetota bacterium]
MRSAACAGDGRRGHGEAGATIVEFLSVAILTVVALLGVVQIAVWTWARNVAVNAAHEGARVAAEAGRPLDDGIATTRALLRDGLGGGGDAYTVEASEADQAVHVAARGEAPSILPFMPHFTVTVQASAFDEDRVAG